jgi:Acetyltransferase (GNAT) domain
MSVRSYAGFDAVPGPVLSFLDDAGQRDFFRSIPWFRTLMRMTGPGDDRLRIYAAERDGRPVAALVARERGGAGRLRAHMLLSPSQGANAAVYGPLLDGEFGAPGLGEIAGVIAREKPAIDVLRFDGLDRGSAEFAALLAACRRAGLVVQRFFNFYNRFEAVSGITLAQYLARRPPSMRDVVGRHLQQSGLAGEVRFALVTGGTGLSAALIDYALVDLQSGMALEPYPDFTLELIRVAAERGVLRLGLLYVDDEPAAAHIWLVSGGNAVLWRPRYAERFARQEIDVALMVPMLRHLFEVDRIDEIEFARDIGDHGGEWVAGLRERVGLVIFNPRTVKGALAAVRHIGGHAAKAAARRARRFVPIRIVTR